MSVRSLPAESHFTLLTLPFNVSVMLFLLMNSEMTWRNYSEAEKQ